MKRALILALVLVVFPVFGEENSGQAQPNINVNIQNAPQVSPYPGQGQKIFDNDVFKSVGAVPSGPSTSKSPYSGSVRTMTPEEDTNSAQRGEWMAACAQYKGRDMEAYRKCFAEQKSKAAENLRQGRDLVERRQGMPMRNTQGIPLIDEGEPAFGGVEQNSDSDSD